MAKYPEIPTRISGYTEQWISEYLKDKATASQINKYIKAIEGKDKKDRKQIFYDTFISKPTFEDELKALAKKKRAEAKKAKEE